MRKRCMLKGIKLLEINHLSLNEWVLCVFEPQTIPLNQEIKRPESLTKPLHFLQLLLLLLMFCVVCFFFNKPVKSSLIHHKPTKHYHGTKKKNNFFLQTFRVECNLKIALSRTTCVNEPMKRLWYDMNWILNAIWWKNKNKQGPSSR